MNMFIQFFHVQCTLQKTSFFIHRNVYLKSLRHFSGPDIGYDSKQNTHAGTVIKHCLLPLLATSVEIDGTGQMENHVTS